MGNNRASLLDRSKLYLRKMSGRFKKSYRPLIGQFLIISTLPFSLTGSRGEYLRVVGIHSDG